MSHPFKKGDKVRCVRAPERTIPITEGETYVVLRAFRGNQDPRDEPIPGMEKTPGIEVAGLAGNYFTADRFELAE
ncbi:hypothetical protein [Novosphingobium sp.]|uniref:hypothetical protein n=1 Tax=Novosphingobium sp. TaxID=1874826 RepID=UPI003D6C9AF2